MFKDRKDAGKKLASELSKYKDKDILVLGIPRGGVEIAFEIAGHLNAEMSLLVSRKLPFPFNPEAGFGAIAEDGSTFISEDAYNWLSGADIERIVKEQKAEIRRRIKVLREGKPLPDMKGRIVILADDGIAIGSTMRAAISMCKNKEAGKIIIAAPVSGGETAGDIGRMADEIVVLEMPPYFQAVAQVYSNWHDVSDNEVLEIIKKWKKDHS